MKKRLAVFTLAILMAFSASACSTYGSIKVTGKQDTSYAVTSNGGLAVQYGNYLYFVNGYRSTTDTNGKNNKFGEVTQGSIYRAELIKDENSAASGTPKYFPVSDVDVAFKSTDNVKNPYYYFNKNDVPIDINDEEITVDPGDEPLPNSDGEPFRISTVNVQQIVSKSITCDSKGNGGLFIFGEYIYYASRNNEKDKGGVVQDNLYDFYRTKLSGSGTQKIYTTKSGDNIQYRFYYYSGSVYLVVHEGTNIVSVQVKSKAQNSVTIAENVVEAILPTKDVYYSGISQNTINDYIFFTRAVEESDPLPSGVIMECMRPNGKNRTEIKSNQSELKLVSVNSDALYYTETRVQSTALVQSIPDLSDGLTAGDLAISDHVLIGSSSNYTQITPFRTAFEDVDGGTVYDNSNSVIFVNGSSLVYRLNNTDHILDNGSITIISVEDDYVYYSKDGFIFRASLATPGSVIAEQFFKKTQTSNTFFNLDFAAGYAFFTANERYSWAPDYVYLKKVTQSVNVEERFIGKLEQTNPDIKTHEGHDAENHI